MNLKTLANIIGDGRMASVDFITKDGRERTVNGRVNVRRYLKGTGKSRNLAKKGQLLVWETLRPQDTDRDGTKRYKTITANNVRVIRANGLEIRATK